MLKFSEQPKTPKGNQLFAGEFRANLDETNDDMVQFTWFKA